MKDFKTVLTQKALKSTTSRLAVLQYLTENTKPLAADAIYDHLKDEHDEADKATIYRTLETFVEKQLIKRLEFGEGKYRYELMGEDHHHLICESCGTIEDVSDCNISDLVHEIAVKKKFTIKRHSLEFFGLCQSCQR